MRDWKSASEIVRNRMENNKIKGICKNLTERSSMHICVHIVWCVYVEAFGMCVSVCVKIFAKYKPFIAVLRLCLRLAEAFAIPLFTGDVLPNKSSNRPSLGTGAA